MAVGDAIEFCRAGAKQGMRGKFVDRMRSLGASGKYPSNYEVEFHRLAKAHLGLDYELYKLDTVIKDSMTVTRDVRLSLLLPHEIAHLLYTHDRERFMEVFNVNLLHRFWLKTIDRNDQWFQNHPLRDQICRASDKSRYLPITIFGDDGTMRKTRMLHTITWMCSLYSNLPHLESRFPGYMLAGHMMLPNITEPAMQAAFVWSFAAWATGSFPIADHTSTMFAMGSTRRRLADSEVQIAGGFIPVYTATICDTKWMNEHYRFQQVWSKIDICAQCIAQDAPGALNYIQSIPFPVRSHDVYMASAAAQQSPLANILGFHLTSVQPEALHVGPLGCMPDHIGSALVEICDAGAFGFMDIGNWEQRLDMQMKAAHAEFVTWAKSFKEDHRVRSFTRAKFSMFVKSTSWPAYKGKGHNCLVICRWLSARCAQFADEHPSSYAHLRSAVLWGWVEFFHLAGHPSDPNWYDAEELLRLDVATGLILQGSKVLANLNYEASKPRWKARPKLHQLWHINQNAQLSHRPVRAFWTWKEEEGMGKLSRIACAVHATRVSDRSLQRWILQFFNAINDV